MILGYISYITFLTIQKWPTAWNTDYFLKAPAELHFRGNTMQVQGAIFPDTVCALN